MTPSEDREGAVVLSSAEIKDLIEKTVDETLVKLGIEAEDYREMQADMLFLRKLRKTHEAVQNKALITLMGVILAGTVSLIVMGIVRWIRSLGGMP